MRINADRPQITSNEKKGHIGFLDWRGVAILLGFLNLQNLSTRFRKPPRQGSKLSFTDKKSFFAPLTSQFESNIKLRLFTVLKSSMDLNRFLTEGMVSEPIRVGEKLTSTESIFYPNANKQIRWGWKRDVGPNHRVVYFSARLDANGEGIFAHEVFFFYVHHSSFEELEEIIKHLTGALKSFRELSIAGNLWVDPGDRGFCTVYFKIGVPNSDELEKASRLVLRQPRRHTKPRVFPSGAATISDVVNLLPCDLYVGSGLSYEAGLPTLCGVHQWFHLDDYENSTFTYGARDGLPYDLATYPEEMLRKFCSLHVNAMKVKPTNAQKVIAYLYRSGLVKNIFTDNVDNLLAKVDVPFIRVRGSGVFNERFPASFSSDAKCLIVSGVGADRRQIISQARSAGLKLVIVDPCKAVAPHVQNLNYIEDRDLFFKQTAESFFTELRNLID